MNVWSLIIKEIHLRRLSFALGALSLMIAVGVLTAQLTLLRAHDLRTHDILEAKQKQTELDMAKMEDDYRQIMKKLGFNLLILPAGQNLGDFYAEGYAAKDMPEEYVQKLADSGLATIRHLVPSLEQKVRWAEQGQRNIILMGTRGEVVQKSLREREVMIDPVAPGTAVLGFEIADSLGLKPGDAITLMGGNFKVARRHAERGTKDDVTIWLNLAEAQEMLKKQGRINAILALQCICPGSDLPTIRKNVSAILPGAQVFETEEKIITREEARHRARATAEASIKAEVENRARVRKELETFAAWLTPLVTIGAAAWIGLLIFMNVRERKTEIGILRALGYGSGKIMQIFLGKSLLLGILGAALGYGVGYLLGVTSSDMGVTLKSARLLFQPQLAMAVAIFAPLLAGIAALPPALWAARLDPAVALREE